MTIVILSAAKNLAPEGQMLRLRLSMTTPQIACDRALDGLSTITGDPKYREAAMQAIKYAFEHLRSSSGLIYWGHFAAYDASADKKWGNYHVFKLHYPYYELMWEVDPSATKRFIEAYWSAHILDWSNLDFNRIARIDQRLEEPWNHEYKGGPTFFESKFGGGGFVHTGTSLIHAGTVLFELSGQQQPLVWSKHLAKRFVDTRHPKTGISALVYNNPWKHLGSDLEQHFADPYTTLFPWNPFETRYLYYPENAVAQPWICMFLVGDMLGKEGEEFKQWALEELTAWGKVSYCRKGNSFIPMLTDGTSIEGYVFKEHTGSAPKGTVVKPYFVDTTFFWAYAVAYRITSNEFMWRVVRDIALGNKYGDIGEAPSHTPQLITDTTCSDVYGLLGLLELYCKTENPAFLEMARRIGDNIVVNQFHKGFFVPSKRHIYTRFDCFEPLVLLHLHAAIKSKSKTSSVPQVWPDSPLFVPSYRFKEEGVDRQLIYTLTDSSEPSLSLQEAAAIGNVELVRSLIYEGLGVDSIEDGFQKTALHRAAISGRKDVAELLLAKGADVNARDSYISAPLHYAAQNGHSAVAELLIARGADINARNSAGDRPLQGAARYDRKDTIKLLLEKGATISNIHLAAYMGDLVKIEGFIQEGVDINVLDGHGYAPLHYAAQNNQKEVIELLISKGADVNVKNWGGETPLHIAVSRGHKDIVELLIAKGADINVKNNRGQTPLDIALSRNRKDIAELLRKHEAKE